MYYFFTVKQKKIKITLANLKRWVIVGDYETTTIPYLLFNSYYVGSESLDKASQAQDG
jgi:hypothetical protein